MGAQSAAARLIPRAFLAAILLCAAPAWASPVINKQTVYYMAFPLNANDLMRALSSRSPIRQGSHVYHGNTDWSVDWRFSLQPVAGGCKLENIRVTLNIKYTLPQLDPRVRDGATVARFRKFSEALSRHEHNHGKNGVAAANEVEKALRTLLPKRDCHTLEATANALGHRIVDKYAKKDREYDRLTGHGRTEGASLE